MANDTNPRNCEKLNVENELSKLEKRLEFLSDSEVFYPLDLGSEGKTVMFPDFNVDGGFSYIDTNNKDKYKQPWYLNYSGFLTDESIEAKRVMKRLVAYLKLYRIHKYLYPMGILTNNDVQYIISYDKSTESFKPMAVEVNGGSPSSPSIGNVYAQFYFETESDVQNAIDLMKTSDGDDSELKSYLGIEHL